MNGVLIMCEMLAAWTIVGAVESEPNWVTIDYIDRHNNADFVVIPKEIYEECTAPDAGVSRL